MIDRLLEPWPKGAQPRLPSTASADSGVLWGSRQRSRSCCPGWKAQRCRPIGFPVSRTPRSRATRSVFTNKCRVALRSGRNGHKGDELNLLRARHIHAIFPLQSALREPSTRFERLLELSAGGQCSSRRGGCRCQRCSVKGSA